MILMSLVLWIVSVGEVALWSNKDVVIKPMTTFSETIGSHVLLCRNEISFEDNVIESFLDFWTGEPLEDLKMGCVIKCVFEKLEVTKPTFELKHANAEALLEACGHTKVMIKALIELYNMCVEVSKPPPCSQALQIARCFRAGIFDLNWDPVLVNPDFNIDEEMMY